MIRTSVLAIATAAGAATCLIAVPSADGTTPPACGNAALTVSATGTQGATGHGNLVLRFRNHTSHSCRLYGYPGLDALTASGRLLAHAKRTASGFTGGSPSGPHTVVVTPGHYASADLEWLNFNPKTSGPCAFSHSIATTPPNTTHTVHLTRSVSACGLQIHPAVAGTSGNG
jgi:hypothetical protein